MAGILRRVGLGGLAGLFLMTLPGGMSAQALETVIVVNDTTDTQHNCFLSGSGVCSLRDAILFANSNPGFDTIRFELPGVGVRTIQVTSPLPALTDAEGVLIDGYSQLTAAANSATVGSNAAIRVQLDGALAGPAAGLQLFSGTNTIRGLSITRFSGSGIVLQGAGNTLTGNFVGVDPSGAAGSNGTGITAGHGAQNTTIGGENVMLRNVISSNAGDGIAVFGPGTGFTRITANLIGTDLNAVGDRGNGGWGIRVIDATDTTMTSNVIAYNGPGGIGIDGDMALRNRAVLNQFFANDGLGIDLGAVGVTPNDSGDTDLGPNFLQNSPVLTGAFLSASSGQMFIQGTLDSNMLAGVVDLEFYRADVAAITAGEGRFSIHREPAAGSGNFSFSFGPFAPTLAESSGNYVTAVATSMDGSSEFATNIAVAVNTPPVANAGASTTANVGATVTLNGAASADADARPLPLAYTWTQKTGKPVQISGNHSAQASFVPQQGGTYTFELRVNDGLDDSIASTVSVTIGDTHVPVALPQTVSTYSGTPKSIRLTGTDVEASALTFKLVTPPVHGSMAGFNETTGVAIYTAVAGYSGNDTFTFTVSDGINTSPPATVTIVVSAGLNVNTTSPAPATQGRPYTVKLGAVGGTGPYTWQSPPGALPPGLTIDSAGVITGVPSVAGTFTFTVTVGDTTGLVSTKNVTVVVVSATTRPYRMFAILGAADD